MMTVGQLARKAGLSRTALLYYHRIGLLSPTARSPAGYRLYDGDSLERLKRIMIYRQAGLGVGEIKQLLDMPETDSSLAFKRRVAEIDREVAELRAKQRLLIRLLRESGAAAFPDMDKETWVEILRRSGMRPDQMDRWYAEFEEHQPRTHRAFLLWLGIPEDEVARIRARALRKKNDRGRKRT